MTVKTYDIRGKLYATYTGVTGILKDCRDIKYTLAYNNGETEKLSVQEVTMEVKQ